MLLCDWLWRINGNRFLGREIVWNRFLSVDAQPGLKHEMGDFVIAFMFTNRVTESNTEFFCQASHVTRTHIYGTVVAY